MPYKQFEVIESIGKRWKKKLQPLDCPGKINFDNLIKIKTEAKLTTRNIKIDNHIDIAILMETWLTDSIEDDPWLKSCEFIAPHSKY